MSDWTAGVQERKQNGTEDDGTGDSGLHKLLCFCDFRPLNGGLWFVACNECCVLLGGGQGTRMQVIEPPRTHYCSLLKAVLLCVYASVSRRRRRRSSEPRSRAVVAVGVGAAEVAGAAVGVVAADVVDVAVVTVVVVVDCSGWLCCTLGP